MFRLISNMKEMKVHFENNKNWLLIEIFNSYVYGYSYVYDYTYETENINV